MLTTSGLRDPHMNSCNCAKRSKPPDARSLFDPIFQLRRIPPSASLCIGIAKQSKIGTCCLCRGVLWNTELDRVRDEELYYLKRALQLLAR